MTEKQIRFSFYILSCLTGIFLIIGVTQFLLYFGSPTPTAEYNCAKEYINTKVGLAFAAATGFGLLATILYNIRQSKFIETQARIQSFEKKFYEHLDYLENNVIPNFKYENFQNKIVTGFDAFEAYMNKFKRKYTVDKKSLTYEYSEDTFDQFNEFYNDTNGDKILQQFILTLKILFRITHEQADFNNETKEDYFTIIYSRLNIDQTFFISLYIRSNPYDELAVTLEQYNNFFKIILTIYKIQLKWGIAH